MHYPYEMLFDRITIILLWTKELVVISWWQRKDLEKKILYKKKKKKKRESDQLFVFIWLGRLRNEGQKQHTLLEKEHPFISAGLFFSCTKTLFYSFLFFFFFLVLGALHRVMQVGL